MKSRPVPERKARDYPAGMAHDPQVKKWVERMLADPDATPSDVSELQLRFIIEKVMARRHTPLDHEAFERAMVATTPVLAHPKVTDAAEDLGHLTRQPEWQRFWCEWTVQRGRADAQRIVEGVKAVMTTMAVPGYTSHADSAWQLLRKTPELLGHFEALSAACGREFQMPSYQSAMRHMGPAPELAPHLPRLTDDVETLAQRATIEILKALRDEFGYTEIGRRWLVDGTLVPGWAPQKGPKRGVMPEGLTGEAKRIWQEQEDERWARADAEFRKHAPDMGFRAYTHGKGSKNTNPDSAELGRAVRRGSGKAVRGLYHVVLVEQATGLVAVHTTFDATHDEAPGLVDLLSRLFDLWPELHDDGIAECVAGDSAWDEDEWCRMLETDYHLHPIFRWHKTSGGDRTHAKGNPRDARFPIHKGESKTEDVIGRTGDGRLICATHGVVCDHVTLDRPSRDGLRPGQTNKEHKFRLRARCPKCAAEAEPNPAKRDRVGGKGIRAQVDWSNFTFFPHHPQGRPDLYAFRMAMLARLNQVESAFAALKAASRMGAAGTDRPRIRYASTYAALLSLAHLGRASLVIADQRMQRDARAAAAAAVAAGTTAGAGAPASPAASGLLSPPPTVRRYPVRSRRGTRPAATATPTVAAVKPAPPDPAVIALRSRRRATAATPPSWAA